jgi:hypothetical protein
VGRCGQRECPQTHYTTKPGGLGIGLSICRTIIETHGGRLWASANVPRGAVFQFTWPLRSLSFADGRFAGGRVNFPSNKKASLTHTNSFKNLMFFSNLRVLCRLPVRQRPITAIVRNHQTFRLQLRKNIGKIDPAILHAFEDA